MLTHYRRASRYSLWKGATLMGAKLMGATHHQWKVGLYWAYLYWACSCWVGSCWVGSCWAGWPMNGWVPIWNRNSSRDCDLEMVAKRRLRVHLRHHVSHHLRGLHGQADRTQPARSRLQRRQRQLCTSSFSNSVGFSQLSRQAQMPLDLISVAGK